jgi:hypothetical protein
MDSMKHFSLCSFFVFLALTLLSSGCGGGSGSAGGGNGTATFSAGFTMTGGHLVNPTVPGIQDIQVTDVNGTPFTIASVLSPDSIIAGVPVAVIRAGSNLLTGHYTSTTAIYINPVNGNTTPFTINASGTIAHDLVVPPGGIIVLPIDTVGSFSFPNGIRVQIPAVIGHVANVNLSLSGSANLNNEIASTTLTFNGTGFPTGYASITFTDGTDGVFINPSNGGLSPFTWQGATLGTTTSYPTAQVTYGYNN